MKGKKASSGLGKAIMEMAADQHRIGTMDDATYRKITIRHLGAGDLPQAEPINGEQIRSLRAREKMSQAVFAQYLNLTPGYISQWERGVKRPTGPALALLHAIRRHGMAAIL